MHLSVIIPVHDGGEELAQCLRALAASSRPADEVIVVDDASSDRSGETARELGARVVALAGHPRGPAGARNCGAAAAQGDVILFLDADVAVHPDTLAKITKLLDEEPEVSAVFGSYDAQPPGRTTVSLYKNLLHHYTHQQAQREASTFWAGCGAIRAVAFEEVGGFDERYNRPSIEDIELGVRLRKAGRRIALAPDIQVTHLKRWTFTGLLRSDIRDRAIPWCQLILREHDLPNDLNLDTRSRLSALAVWTALLSLLGGIWFPWVLTLAALSLAALVCLQAGLYRLFVRQGGIAFAPGAIGLHAFYFLYSSLTFVLVAGMTIRNRQFLSRS